MSENENQPKGTDESAQADDVRAPYEPPQLLKKRSVSRVTLFSGAGVAVSPITAA